MHPNAQRIHDFYSAFQRRDAEAMGRCYHPDVEFSDEVFRALRGDRARAMWAMLTSSGSDLEITFRDVSADDQRGEARWDAIYTFSKTGRRVHNEVRAEFGFEEGLIRTHHDHFDFYKWTCMALGPSGLLLGWTPLVQWPVRSFAARSLDAFIRKQEKSREAVAPLS